MPQKTKKKPHLYLGQTVGEYVILMALVLAAITAMQVYVQRGLQGRYHDLSEVLIYKVRQAAGNNELPAQYEPYYTLSTAQIYRDADSQEQILPGSVVSRQTSDLVKRKAIQAELPGCVAGEAGCPAYCLDEGEECGDSHPSSGWSSEIPCCHLLSCQNAAPNITLMVCKPQH